MATVASTPLVDIAHLTKDFGAFRAVDDLSFTVQRGEVLGFLGPNGAGKSTTMKMITGFLTPSAGTVKLAGIDMRQDPRGGQTLLGYLPEGAPAWPDMTPRGFLTFIARIRGLDKAAAVKAMDRAVGMTELQPVMDQPIETLSKGFRRRVGLAQAILHDPPILIMDEPTDGLDPNQKYQVRQAIAEMAADKAIIISTHILSEVDALCGRALIIDHGAQVAHGTPTELAARSRFHNAVVLTVDSENAEAVDRALTRKYKTLTIDRHFRGGEIIFVLHPTADKNGKQAAGQTLLREVDEMAKRSRGKTKWQVRSLAFDRGRLDDVFRSLTRGDGAAPRRT